MSLRIL